MQAGSLPTEPPGEPHTYVDTYMYVLWGFPGSSAGKESTCNAGDPGSIPGLGICAREEIGFTPVFLGFCNGSATKESARNVGDLGLIPG